MQNAIKINKKFFNDNKFGTLYIYILKIIENNIAPVYRLCGND